VDPEEDLLQILFTTCVGNQYQCSLWFSFQMLLLNFWYETYVHYWEFIVPLFLVVILLNFD
jgi:hypothetical protein